ncbi:MAG: regulatory protein RecX [Pseudomonadota bacterium]|nr:regulatory protein RecX [Pseudomonadota bacterium]
MAKKISPNYLHNASLFYLERFASSAENLRRVLQRKVMRAAREHETDIDEADKWIEDEIIKLIRIGLLDDTAYTQMRIHSSRTSGASTSKIRAQLMQKGVDADLIDAELDEDDESERRAVFRYAQRRRLGPFRTKRTPESDRKDLAALARAGFSYSIARTITDADDTETLEKSLKDYSLSPDRRIGG